MVISWLWFRCCFRALIAFTKDTSQPDWRGYFLAVVMFTTATVQSFVLHHYFHRCFLTGMRLRSALVSAIYKKVSPIRSYCSCACCKAQLS